MSLIDRLIKPPADDDWVRREQRTAEARNLVDDFLDEVRQNIKDLQSTPDSEREIRLYRKKS